MSTQGMSTGQVVGAVVGTVVGSFTPIGPLASAGIPAEIGLLLEAKEDIAGGIDEKNKEVGAR